MMSAGCAVGAEDRPVLVVKLGDLHPANVVFGVFPDHHVRAAVRGRPIDPAHHRLIGGVCASWGCRLTLTLPSLRLRVSLSRLELLTGNRYVAWVVGVGNAGAIPPVGVSLGVSTIA